jgi:signal transduction histidine kinase
LPLTKRLVDLHHGKIKIESKVGEGTTVTIRLTSDPSLLD